MQRSVGRSCSTSRHHNNLARSSALPAGHCNNAARSNVLQAIAAALLQQRHNNAGSCSAPGHHCSVVRSCSVLSSPAIAAVAVELYTFDFRPTFIGRSFDFRPTSIRFPSDVCPTFVRRLSDFRPRPSVLSLAYVTTDIIVLPTSLLTSSSCLRHC